MKTFAILAGALILFCIIVFASIGATVFFIACSRNGKAVQWVINQNEEKMFGEYAQAIHEGQQILRDYPHEEVTIKSFDGLTLCGYFIKGENPQRTVICVHGYHGGPFHDFGGAAKTLLSCGNILLIDQRAHGKSGGKYITYGVRECRDCEAWAQYICSREDCNHAVYLDGVSMGASSVLMCCSLKLPENVKGIIADCGFTSPYDILESVARPCFKAATPLLLSGVNVFCKAAAGFSLRERSTPEALKENKIPILFAHGTGDRLVPSEMTCHAYEACPSKKQLLLSEKADHGMSFIVNQPKYIEALNELFAYCEKT